MKLKRAPRLIHLTAYFLKNPRILTPLTQFSKTYSAAKSSISEDLAIIKETFESQGIGTIVTSAGITGGVRFIPYISKEDASKKLAEIKAMIETSERLLTGGYLYVSDILGHPKYVETIGEILATAFKDVKVDAVMTIATKGIPIAYAVASCLNVPVITVRQDAERTEGSTVTINYMSGSSKQLKPMVLSRRALKSGSDVLIIDDFMKAGGTINGMIELLQEFDANLAGIGVFIESEDTNTRLVNKYVSLLQLKDVNLSTKAINVESGNYEAFI